MQGGILMDKKTFTTKEFNELYEKNLGINFLSTLIDSLQKILIPTLIFTNFLGLAKNT